MSFYDQNSDEYFAKTQRIEMSAAYQKFIPLLPKNGKILDAGCGSGRDARCFREMGFSVTAFDASIELVRLAREKNGVDASHDSFEAFDCVDVFDGIWACASLLHVPHSRLTRVIRKLTLFLKPNGFFYVSFKEGTGVHQEGERTFSDLTEHDLRTVIESCELRLQCLWRNDIWINAISEKSF